MKLYVYNLREFDERKYFEAWCKNWGVEYEATAQSPTAENLKEVREYDAISIITTPFGRDCFEALKGSNVKCVSTRTVGYDHMDLEAAKEMGIVTCNAPYPPNSVANYAIMLMLMCCRKVVHILDRSVVQDYSLIGKMGMDISHCTVGVVGTGQIGRTVISHLQGFGCRVLACDLYPSKEVEGMAEYVDLETLYKESDLITLHMPSTPENFHMINDETLAKMKDGVILINTARGSLIDSDALIRAIEAGKVGSAGLDVIENESDLYYNNKMGEPLDNKELAILRAFPNVIVTPHTAFYTAEAVENMVKNSITGCLNAVNKQENRFEIKK